MLDSRPTPTVRCGVFASESKGGHARYSFELLSAVAEARDRGVCGDVEPVLLTSRGLSPRFRDAPYEIRELFEPATARPASRGRLAHRAYLVRRYLEIGRTLVRWAAAPGGCALVHFQEYPSWLLPGLVARLRRRGIRACFTVHNITMHSYPLKGHSRPVLDRLNRLGWRRCDALFVHSEGLAAELAAFLGPGHPPIRVTPHGLWRPLEAGGARREDSRGPLRLLFFGVIRPNKGLHVLLDSMASLSGMHLEIAGECRDAAYRGRIARSIERAGAGNTVHHVDRFVTDEEMEGLFRRADVVVLPYLDFSAQSGVLHAAMTYGVPVVATDVGALRETVERHGIGEVARPGDEGSLAEAIRRISSPGRLAAAREACARIDLHGSWAHAAEVTLRTYAELLGPANAPSPGRLAR